MTKVREVAVVLDFGAVPIYWSDPGEQGYIPDSLLLWQILWKHRWKGEERQQLWAVLHTHPWDGFPRPSATDITTFRAVELGLGHRVTWGIVTFDKYLLFVWDGWAYVPVPLGDLEPNWSSVLQELRRRSGKEE